MQKIIALTTVCGALLAVGSARATNLVTDGNFASGFTFWTANNIDVVPEFDGDYVSCCGATGASPNGTLASYGSGGHPSDGSVSQTVATTIGDEYVLTFDYGSFGFTLQQLAVGVTGQTTNTVTSGVASSDLSTLFGTYTESFVATAASTVFSFTDVSTTDGSSTDSFLTGVSLADVSPVPEPASLALLGAGLAGLGFGRRRKA